MSLIARLGNGGDYKNPHPLQPAKNTLTETTYDVLGNYAYSAEKKMNGRKTQPTRQPEERLLQRLLLPPPTDSCCIISFHVPEKCFGEGHWRQEETSQDMHITLCSASRCLHREKRVTICRDIKCYWF